MEGSIRQIRDVVDFVVAVGQSQSNFGETDDTVLPAINHLQQKGLVNTIHHYTPNLKLGGTENETIKRNIGIDIARNNGCTHYLLMDCDEYYDTLQFLISKQVIKMRDYDTTCCTMFTYYKKPTYQLYPKENYYVPFIQKIYPETKVGMYRYPVLCDNTRVPNKYHSFYPFRESELVMHHYSHVRNDYEKKLRNSSAKINWEREIKKRVAEYDNFKIGDKLSFFPEHTVIEVENTNFEFQK